MGEGEPLHEMRRNADVACEGNGRPEAQLPDVRMQPLRMAAVLLGLVALQIVLYVMVVGLSWPQVGALIAIGSGANFISHTIAPQRCKSCGGTKWTVIKEDDCS